jgi:menaquinone-dependent protoporphyrinogen oxidase
MHVLICYASTEGQTRKIALHAAESFMRLGHHTVVKETSIADADDFKDCDAIILAGSLHIGRYQPALTECIVRKQEFLRRKPAALISVSLSAAGDENDLRDADGCVKKLAEKTGWTADMVHHAAGAFRFSQYGFFKRWVMRMAAMVQDKTVKTGVDKEYTDWNALERFVGEFAEFADSKRAA